MQYQDADLAKGENILDNWGLMQIYFHHQAALEFTTHQIRLKQGRTIGDLMPAPCFPALWRSSEAAGTLFSLIATARSRLVRLWAMEMLQQEHATQLAEIPLEKLFALLEHADEEVQQFAARLAGSHRPAMSSLPLATWFKLLETRNMLALEAMCRTCSVTSPVSGSALDDCIRLACCASVPVARLGLAFLKARTIASARRPPHAGRRRGRKVRGHLRRTWPPGPCSRSARRRTTIATPCCDSSTATGAGVRGKRPGSGSDGHAARGGSAGYADAGLWCRLLETPYDDLRLPLIDELSRARR